MPFCGATAARGGGRMFVKNKPVHFQQLTTFYAFNAFFLLTYPRPMCIFKSWTGEMVPRFIVKNGEKIMIQAQYIVDLSNGYRGRIESVLDKNGAVAYSGALYNQGGPNLTLEEYKQAKNAPHLVLVSSSELDDLERAFEASLKTAPTAITAEQYDYWLGCLPPSRWQHIDGCDVFHLCERLRGNLVQWCFTKGGKYYGFTDDAALSVDALRAIINEVAA